MVISQMIWVYMLMIGLVLFIAYWKTGRFIKCLLFSGFTGVSSLGIIWLIGRLFPVAVDITALSLAGAALLGIPGVITMLILNLI